MPIASVGAPPVRETMLSSPTFSAACWRNSGEVWTPDMPRELLMKSAAPWTVPPVSGSAAFIAK